jgi:hypothetical protein
MVRPTVGLAPVLVLSVVAHTSAAVIPLVDDGLSLLNEGGPRAPLLADAMFGVIAGHWSGKTDSGRAVTLVLRVNQGAVTGNMNVAGVAHDTSRPPLALKRAMFSGRTVIFSVQPTECEKSLAHGSVTFVARGSAQLDIRMDGAPMRVMLSKVGWIE